MLMLRVIGKCFFFILVTVFVVSCAKETSYESGKNLNGKSVGTLKDSLGDCQGITIHGNYQVDTALVADNYVLVQINVTTPGQYTIYTDTANGFWFRDSGYIPAGLNVIKLKGYGKPMLGVSTSFIVTYNNSFCLFTIPVGVVTAAPVYRDYFPTTIGSNWGYDIAGLSDTLHIEASPADKTIASNLYRKFRITQASTPDDSSFFRKVGNDYYQYNAPDPFGSTFMDYIMLKDDQPVGTQWDSPTAPTTFPAASEFRIHFTILAKNTSVTINNVVFDSVIRVQHNYQYKVLGNYQNYATGDAYFAKNIGLIKVEEPGLFLQTIKRWKVY